MIISIDAEKEFDKIQHSCMIKNKTKHTHTHTHTHTHSTKLREVNILNLTKEVYKKSTASIIFNAERLNVF